MGAQREHPVADRAGLARPLRARPGGAEQFRPARTQLMSHLVHRGHAVAERLGDLGRGGVLDEVGT